MTEITLMEQLRLWQEQGQYEAMTKAILALGEGLDYEVSLYLAWARNQQEQFDEAIDVLLRKEAEGEHDPRWHVELGKSYMALGQDDLAQDQFEQALLLDGQDESVWQLLEACTTRLGVQSEVLKKLRPESGLLKKNMACYTAEEMTAVREHILTYFGQYRIIQQNRAVEGYPVDIILIAPTQQRPFYTMMTLGMGAYRMNVPKPLQINKLDRAELLICLPADYPMDGAGTQSEWSRAWLDMLAYLPLKEDGWLGWGHTVPAEESFMIETEQCAAILCNPCAVPEEAAICPLPDGNEINFYQLIPIYGEELAYKMEHGAEALFDRFEQVDHVVDLQRANTCAAWPDKQWAIAQEAMQPFLTKWQGADQALATDRIIVEGLPVGYMYREEPIIGEESDSGWRFMAGNETEDYLNNAEHFGVYDLNVLCNYDPDILPYLTAPVGSAFYRDSDDVFQPDNSYQGTVLSFAKRTKNFWQWFVYYEPLLLSIMANADEYRSEDVVAMLSEGTSRLAENVQFTVRGDGVFSFLADGVFCRFYLMPYVVANMPKSLQAHWTFWPWIQPPKWPGAKELPAQFLAWQDMYLSLNPSEEAGQYNVRFFHEQLLAIDEQKCYGTFYLVLEMLLGEAMVYMYIHDAQRTEQIEADMFPLQELLERLQKLILSTQSSIDTDPTKHFTTYTRQPEDRLAPRFDVVWGETCYPEIIMQYYQNQPLAASVITLYGAQALYLSFAHDGQLSLEEQELLCKKLQKRLEGEVLGVPGNGEELGIILGGAVGEKCCYVDLLLFDTQAFLAKVGHVLKDYPYIFYLAPFYQHALPMTIPIPN